MIQEKYGIEFIHTGCCACRENGFPLPGHAYCTPTASDDEFPETVLIRSTWYGFRTRDALVKFMERDQEKKDGNYMKDAEMAFQLKLGTFERASSGEPCEVVTMKMRTPLNSEVTSIVMSVVADTNVPPDMRGAEIGKLLVCTAITRWFGKRPEGVTPYGVPTYAVDNIPEWMLDELVEKAQQLYNESMKEMGFCGNVEIAAEDIKEID